MYLYLSLSLLQPVVAEAIRTPAEHTIDLQAGNTNTVESPSLSAQREATEPDPPAYSFFQGGETQTQTQSSSYPSGYPSQMHVPQQFTSPVPQQATQVPPLSATGGGGGEGEGGQGVQPMHVPSRPVPSPSLEADIGGDTTSIDIGISAAFAATSGEHRGGGGQGQGTGGGPPPPMPSRATKPYSRPPLEGLDPALAREWSQSSGVGKEEDKARYSIPVSNVLLSPLFLFGVHCKSVALFSPTT